MLVGIALVAVGTFITPFMTTTVGLILSVGLLAAGGAGVAGPAVLMGATARRFQRTNKVLRLEW